jgi:GNAT superfamily N-acetyltransferase
MSEIVFYNPEIHFSLFEDFIKKSYGRDDYILLSKKFLKWQFLDNPFNNSGNYTLKLFVKEGTILGQIGFIPVRLSLPGNKIVDACYPVNLIVNPDFRALGIGFFLLKDIMKDYPFIINPGSSSEGEKLCKGLGMKTLGFLKRYAYIVSEKKARLIFSGNGEAFDKLKIVKHAKIPSKIINQPDFDLSSEDIFKVFGIDYFPCHIVRNRDFLTWRYLGHPFFDYKFFFSDNHRGLLIYREEIEPNLDVRIWRIVEMLAPMDSCRMIIDRLIGLAFSAEVTMVDFICSFKTCDDVLKSIGFLSDESDIVKGLAYLFQPLDFRKTGTRLIISNKKGLEDDMDRWYITKGDSDQDRPNSFNPNLS